MKVNLYTDASLGNNVSLKTAGIGVVIENPESEERLTYSTYLKDCDDINIAEMYAIYYGIKKVKELNNDITDIRLVVDNKTCVDLLLGTAKLFSEKINYTKEQKKRKLELKKWFTAVKSYAKSFNIKISHINGHKTYFSRYNINNAMADILSRDGIRKYLDDHNKKDNRYKRNESWKNKQSGRIE